MPVSPTIRDIQPPIIQELQKDFTPNTLSLAQGVPFFPPPKKALFRTCGELKEPAVHRYSGDAGLPALREALAHKLAKENGISVPPGQVMVTAGANQAFINAILGVARAGDEVILLTPYYFNHEMALRMFGITPVMVPTDQNYQPHPPSIREAVTEKTRAIVTVSPNNPTGAIYNGELLDEITALCREKDIYHISDETYEYFIYGDELHHSPGGGGGERKNVINLFSFSKAYGMSGWRLGYMCYPEELHDALLKIQDTLIICPSVPSQLLGLECLNFGKVYTNSFLPQIRKSREVMLEALREMDAISFPETTGGYFFFVRVDTRLRCREMSRRLIWEYDVAVVPGEAFGSTEGCYLRLSYGNVTPEQAEEGMRRFVKGVEELG